MLTRPLISRMIWIALLGLASCSLESSNPLPAVDQFQTPAAGTPIPAGQEAVPIDLPSSSSGVLFVNQGSAAVRVVVSDTIATIPPAQSFLFVLPPNAYEFYIYEPGVPPRSHREQTESGKVRYVYLVPLLLNPR